MQRKKKLYKNSEVVSEVSSSVKYENDNENWWKQIWYYVILSKKGKAEKPILYNLQWFKKNLIVKKRVNYKGGAFN